MPQSDLNILSVLAGILHWATSNSSVRPARRRWCVLDGDNAKKCASRLRRSFEGGRWKSRTVVARRIVLADEVIHKSLSAATASHSRDALATSLYSKLFDLLVDRVNASIGHDESCKSCIGVLDIYGFESLAVNSFEQFCINFANEKLQQHFNQHVFKMEQEEYEKEGIDWSYIDFVDNQAYSTRLSRSNGIISLLTSHACLALRRTNNLRTSYILA